MGLDLSSAIFRFQLKNSVLFTTIHDQDGNLIAEDLHVEDVTDEQLAELPNYAKVCILYYLKKIKAIQLESNKSMSGLIMSLDFLLISSSIYCADTLLHNPNGQEIRREIRSLILSAALVQGIVAAWDFNSRAATFIKEMEVKYNQRSSLKILTELIDRINHGDFDSIQRRKE